MKSECGQPGKPNRNVYVERFNRTHPDEVLDQHLFASEAYGIASAAACP
ncbi:MAG: transposase [Chromatiales bacterium]|nr:transposase [Chromatiales bacterium]